MRVTKESIIRFWPHSVDKNTASFRMRCEVICQELQKKNLDIAYSIDGPHRCNTLILSYRHDMKSLAYAKSLKEQYQTKIILDIVDNHFIVTDNITEITNNAVSLKMAIKSVDAIITSSEYMKSIIREELNNCSVPIYVIDDIVEEIILPKYTDYVSNPKALISLSLLEKKLKRKSKNKKYRIVWYGNHGGDHPEAGMSALLLYRSVIEEMSREYPLSLTIISNSKEKYKELVEFWNLPTFYLEWDALTISKALMMHGIAVLPINKNVYTLSKSSNRVSKSLAHGLQVIADEIPSYSRYLPYIYLDNPRAGFREYLAQGGKNLSCFDYHVENRSIIKLWEEILTSV